MSGGKGGSNTSSVQIPSWLEDAAKTNLSKAEYAGNIGYTPYYGPDVAAQTQNQLLGNQATYDAAAAFGLVPQGGNANAGMPTPTTYAGGVSGYSSGDLYDQAVAELASRRPGQAEALNAMFIDPYSGESQTAFTPAGSIGTSSASDYMVRDGQIYTPGNYEPVEAKSDLQKLYEIDRYLSSPSPEMSFGQVLKPGGMLELITDPLARSANKYARENLVSNSPQISAITDAYGSYQNNLGRNSNWNSSLTSGPDISYSSARDKSSTTGYNFNRD